MSSRMDKINKAKGIVEVEHPSWDQDFQDQNSALEMSKNSPHSYSVGGSYQDHIDGEIFEEKLWMWRNEY